jgi:hypothetical protein
MALFDRAMAFSDLKSFFYQNGVYPTDYNDLPYDIKTDPGVSGKEISAYQAIKRGKDGRTWVPVGERGGAGGGPITFHVESFAASELKITGDFIEDEKNCVSCREKHAVGKIDDRGRCERRQERLAEGLRALFWERKFD